MIERVNDCIDNILESNDKCYELVYKYMAYKTEDLVYRKVIKRKHQDLSDLFDGTLENEICKLFEKIRLPLCHLCELSYESEGYDANRHALLESFFVNITTELAEKVWDPLEVCKFGTGKDFGRLSFSGKKIAKTLKAVHNALHDLCNLTNKLLEDVSTKEERLRLFDEYNAETELHDEFDKNGGGVIEKYDLNDAETEFSREMFETISARSGMSMTQIRKLRKLSVRAFSLS